MAGIKITPLHLRLTMVVGVALATVSLLVASALPAAAETHHYSWSGQPVTVEGNYGGAVVGLQMALAGFGFSDTQYGIDGQFGSVTLGNLKQYQWSFARSSSCAGATGPSGCDGAAGSGTWTSFQNRMFGQASNAGTTQHPSSYIETTGGCGGFNYCLTSFDFSNSGTGCFWTSDTAASANNLNVTPITVSAHFYRFVLNSWSYLTPKADAAIDCNTNV